MKSVMKLPKLATFLLVNGYLSLVYTITNFWAKERPTFFVETRLDDFITFVPQSVYVYILGYIFLLQLPLWYKEYRQFVITSMGIFWITTVSGIIFVIYPTTIVKPDVIQEASSSEFLVHVLRRIDPPNNCYPSMHVSLSTFIAFVCYHINFWPRLSIAIACLVSLSTLLLKQHVLMDVAGGIALSMYAYFLFKDKLYASI